jgi:hypothetical protein
MIISIMPLLRDSNVSLKYDKPVILEFSSSQYIISMTEPVEFTEIKEMKLQSPQLKCFAGLKTLSTQTASQHFDVFGIIR